VDHDAIGAAIDPTLIRLAGDVEAASAYVTPAVGLVPLRHRELGNVDVVASHHILEDRAVSDVFGRDARHRPDEIGAEPFAQLDLAEIRRKAERHVLALAAEEVHQHTAALKRAGDVVEHEAGRPIVVQRHFGDHADVALPGKPTHLLDLAERASSSHRRKSS
jgi:hypothetical protein